MGNKSKKTKDYYGKAKMNFQNQKKGNIVIRLLIVLGCLCFLYSLVIFSYAGCSVKFHFIWDVIAVACFLLAFIVKGQMDGKFHIPSWIRTGFWGMVVLVLILFLFVEGILITYALHKPKKKADYMIVLGCQVRGENITKALEYRLQVAVKYGLKNNTMKIIVSGGQGDGEAISEAEAMRRYLIQKGIAKKRIIMEDQSTNTMENIKYSKKLLPSLKERVIVVSNGFHMFRAVRICRKQGLQNIEYVSGSSDVRMAAAYYLREFFAVVKDYLVGNI